MTDSVIFDMDGVLFDSERLYNKAWYRVGTKMNLPDIEVDRVNNFGWNALIEVSRLQFIFWTFAT